MECELSKGRSIRKLFCDSYSSKDKVRETNSHRLVKANGDLSPADLCSLTFPLSGMGQAFS